MRIVNHVYHQSGIQVGWDMFFLNRIKNVDDLVTWFLNKEIKSAGDWNVHKENLAPGGWAFQFNNDYYPDVDDTALVGMFLDRYNRKKKLKKLNNALNERENGLFQCNQKMGDGAPLILIIQNIILIPFLSLIMVHYLTPHCRRFCEMLKFS